jgi:hypothetical protein
LIGQQSAFPQHFVHVNLLHAGVAISPSVVPLLAGYEHEHPVEHVPLPPETLIHFAKSAYQRHVHDPVQGCSVVVVVVVDDVLVPVLVVVVVVGAAVVVVLVVELVVLVDVLVVVLEVVDEVVELVVVVVDATQSTYHSSSISVPGSLGAGPHMHPSPSHELM